jgi:hypothetical protein
MILRVAHSERDPVLLTVVLLSQARSGLLPGRSLGPLGQSGKKTVESPQMAQKEGAQMSSDSELESDRQCWRI